MNKCRDICPAFVHLFFVGRTYRRNKSETGNGQPSTEFFLLKIWKLAEIALILPRPILSKPISTIVVGEWRAVYIIYKALLDAILDESELRNFSSESRISSSRRRMDMNFRVPETKRVSA